MQRPTRRLEHLASNLAKSGNRENPTRLSPRSVAVHERLYVSHSMSVFARKRDLNDNVKAANRNRMPAQKVLGLRQPRIQINIGYCSEESEEATIIGVCGGVQRRTHA
jgi:hypothetical protein